METLVAHGSPPLEENNGRHDVMIPAKLDPRYGEYLLLGLYRHTPDSRTERQMSRRAVRHRLCPRDEATQQQRAKACQYKAWLASTIAWVDTFHHCNRLSCCATQL
jgi:hypothetical protein